MGLINEEVKKALEDIIGWCFWCNRVVDRICSVLSINFVMPITSKLLHLKLAHLYPLLADDVSDYMDSRDCSVIYHDTPIGDQEYESSLDCFVKMLTINLDLEKRIHEAIAIAKEQGDYSTKIFLENYLLKILPITQDLLTLEDKAEMYGDTDMSNMKLDHDIHSFGIFGD